jgi:hypothetical protein
MSSADLHTLIATVEGALAKLGYPAEPERVERWALLVHRSMSGHGRSFHRAEHIMELAQGADPLETLAVVFHDVVYLQVDQGLPRALEGLLTPYLDLVNNQPVVRPGDLGREPSVALGMRLFAVRPGDEVAKVTGVNEFMSALVAATTLGELLPLPQLAAILACIEATIPFRTADASGLGPFERLEARLRAASAELGLGLDESAVRGAMERAVWVANKDVANFADHAVPHFLENTWKLLPEGNPSLRNHELYTAGEYRAALQKMEGFLSSLQAERVFHRYGAVPTEEEHRDLVQRAAHNLAVAARYLRVKLLAIAYLEALAKATGGDAPLELFMGGLHPEMKGRRLEDHLPLPRGGSSTDRDPLVVELLEGGRGGEAGFDLQQAPVAAFLYRHYGATRCDELFVSAQGLAAGRLTPQEFLAAQDPYAVRCLASAAAEVARTRSAALRDLARRM